VAWPVAEWVDDFFDVEGLCGGDVPDGAGGLGWLQLAFLVGELVEEFEFEGCCADGYVFGGVGHAFGALFLEVGADFVVAVCPAFFPVAEGLVGDVDALGGEELAGSAGAAAFHG